LRRFKDIAVFIVGSFILPHPVCYFWSMASKHGWRICTNERVYAFFHRENGITVYI